MIAIIPAVALKAVAEFGERVLMRLAIKWHKKQGHNLAEKWRAEEAELQKKEEQNEK